LYVDASLAGLLGVLVGSLTALASSFFSSRRERRTEEERWRRARVDELWKEERRSLLELTTLLADACQAAAWVTWAATVKQTGDLKVDLEEYDARMRALLPKLFSAQAAASGFRDKTSGVVDPLVDQLMTLDVEIGNASVQLNDSPETAIKRLAALRSRAFSMTRIVVQDIRSELRVTNSYQSTS
jgi:hypothetical protein